jgi:hypothetical protein
MSMRATTVAKVEPWGEQDFQCLPPLAAVSVAPHRSDRKVERECFGQKRLRQNCGITWFCYGECLTAGDSTWLHLD